jgi:hypothetical protein
MIKGISNKDGTVIYCTHTHHLLDPKYIPPKCIYLVKKDKNKIISLSKINEIKTQTKKETELQPVYEALGVSDWDFFTQNQKIIAVEGIYDKYAIETFTDIKKGQYIVIPCSNAEAVYNQIPKFIAYGKKYLAIWDNDDEGRKYFEKAQKNFGKLEKEKLLILPNPKKVKKIRMEEMFVNDDISKLAVFLGLEKQASYENVLVTLITSTTDEINKSKNLLSKETKENFETLYKEIEQIFKTKN